MRVGQPLFRWHRGVGWVAVFPFLFWWVECFFFKFDKLYKDIAVAVGTGIRMDFNYFIIRVDYALKMKDPTRLQNDGWLDIRNLKWAEVKPNGVKVNNYALQFGIGLPF
jgi:hypothetical protein